MNRGQKFAEFLILFVGLIFLLLTAAAAPAPGSDGGGPNVSSADHSDKSGDLKDVLPLHPNGGAGRKKGIGSLPPNAQGGNPDPVVQTITAGLAPSPSNGFEGLGLYNYAVGVAPPDTEGAVGPNHYVQWVNEAFAVFDKNTGAILYGPAAGNTLWQGFGGPCEEDNDGDPIVLYDHLANRWLFSQFAVDRGPPYLACVAVSQTPDPLGAYYRYSFSYTYFNDYTKFGIWPDGYYLTQNMFQGSFRGANVCAYDRTSMLAGLSATQVCFTTNSSYGGLLPSDLDGPQLPPTGAPNYLLNIGTGALNLWNFHVDFTTPGNSTFVGPTAIPVATFSEACGGGTCIPQLGTTQTLDSIADRLMYRLAYRNFGDHEALVVNHSVGSPSGIRWYELRSTPPGSSPTLFQQGTFAPDSTYRWIGSVAMDRAGDIAVGYSASSSSINPGIRYSGRLPSDTLGNLQAETTVINGAGSQQSGLSRWGDYSAMSVDPADDCTFWYTNEYLKFNGSFNWSTWITSFKFPSCVPILPPAPTGLTGTPGNTQVGLSWNAATGATSYNVLRSTTSRTGYSTIATGLTSTGYTNTGLTNGTTYYYVVDAVNSSGTSSFSTEASATPCGVPAIPTGLGATPGDATVSLTWTASSGATSYNVKRSGTNGGPYTTIAPSVSTSYTDTSVTNGLTYYYVVSGVDACGESGNSTQVSATPISNGSVNVALASNGGVATASSSYNSGYPASGANNGDRKGLNWAAGGGWNDATPDAWPDWLEVDFNGSKTINEVDVFTVQDNYNSPSDPTPSMTFSLYGITDFQVQYLSGGNWLTVPGGTISGNNLVWRQVTFSPLTTTAIRVWVTGALADYSRITEVEAYAPPSNPVTVSVTSPTQGQNFAAPATIPLTASASSINGISKVDYFANGSPIGTSTMSPSYSVSWGPVAAGSYSLTAVATDTTNATATSAPVGITVNAAGRINVALASNGGVATASSSFSSAYPTSAAIDGDREGLNWGAGGGWNDETIDTWPDWLEVDFNGTKTINEVDVFTLQDNYPSPSDPTPGMTFTQYGVTDFQVQYWTGSAWATLPGAIVSGNNLVWRQFTFSGLTTSGIRVLVTGALAGYSRITEVEAYTSPVSVSLTSPTQGAIYTAGAAIPVTASPSSINGISKVDFFANGSPIGTVNTLPYTLSSWTPAAGNYTLTAVATDNTSATATSAPVGITVNPAASHVNVALAANGGVATASSTYSSAYPASGAIDGDRKGLNWAAGGGWNDVTAGVWPDWLEVDFNGSKTINEIDVFTVQDNYASPSDPTLGMTFTQYGMTDFQVQYWNGSAWAAVPGATVSSNNLVWRQFTFTALTTTSIRVLVTGALADYSRITEVEAYTQ
jgi:hypothetical protein